MAGTSARPILASISLICHHLAPANARSESDWPPIPPEELALRDNHLNPGAHAVILDREIYTDHVDHNVSDSKCSSAATPKTTPIAPSLAWLQQLARQESRIT